MKKLQGFTLIELLISMTVASFIIMAMMQCLRSANLIIKKTQYVMSGNRRVCLMFNQMERDFNSTIIPTFVFSTSLSATGTDSNSGSNPPPTEPKTKKTADGSGEKIKNLQLSDCFKSKIYDDSQYRALGEKYEMFKSVSFINTNPLKMHGTKSSRLIRVLYELVPAKERPKGKSVYSLIRKETTDLTNVACKEPEDANAKNKASQKVITHLIADNIKDFSVQWVSSKSTETEKTNETNSDNEPEIKSFVWGKDNDGGLQKKEKNVHPQPLPQYVKMRISFWNDAKDDAHTYKCIVPILAYPPYKPDTKKQSSSSTPQSQTGAMNQPPAQQPVSLMALLQQKQLQVVPVAPPAPTSTIVQAPPPKNVPQTFNTPLHTSRVVESNALDEFEPFLEEFFNHLQKAMM